MIRSRTAWVLMILAPALAHGQTVYRCETAEGIEFSGTPCADDAERMELESSVPGRPATARRQATGEPVDAAELMRVAGRPAAEVLEVAGLPAAVFVDSGVEHWLYPNACQGERDRVCAELLVEDGTSFQITWLPEDVMRRSVPIVRGFAGWQPPATVREKNFAVAGLEVRGWSKSRFVGRFGQPDVKKVFNAVEVWEYHQVRLDTLPSQRITLYVEFDGDKVSQTIGN